MIFDLSINKYKEIEYEKVEYRTNRSHLKENQWTRKRNSSWLSRVRRITKVGRWTYEKKWSWGKWQLFINGYAFKPQDWSTEGKEIIRIQNLTKTSKEINYYSGKIDKKYIVETGDILISWSGTLGVFQWYGKTAVLNQHIFKAVFDKLDINKSYFKYVVEKGLQDAVKNTHGSTMKHLTKKIFW